MKNWCLEIWGDYACFTRPEMKVERVSYDVITPSAARAVFEAILWKPAIRWNITKIEVLNPVKWTTIRRNEVSKTSNAPPSDYFKGGVKKGLGIFIEDERQQRASTILRDVKYRIHGCFEFIPPENRAMNRPASEELWDPEEIAEIARFDEKEAKYAAIFERRAIKGQCFHRPYLGTREFACNFRLVKEPDDVSPFPETRNLGYMLYDIDFSNIQDPKPEFFKAELKNGVMLTDRQKIEVVS